MEKAENEYNYFDDFVCDECGKSVDAIYGVEEWCEELGLSDEFRQKLIKFVRRSSDWTLYEDYCEECFNELKAAVEKVEL